MIKERLVRAVLFCDCGCDSFAQMDSLYVSDLLYCRALPGCDTIGNAVYGTSYVGMWRSLVARFVRDAEAAGSTKNPLTKDKKM